jgi:hypothetical protein
MPVIQLYYDETLPDYLECSWCECRFDSSGWSEGTDCPERCGGILYNPDKENNEK